VLEPCDGKLSRTVLRGERGGNAPDLPGLRNDMREFGKSALLVVTICGCIASATMLLAHPFSHLLYTSQLSKAASVYFAGAGLLLLVVSVAGLFIALRSGIDFTEAPGARTTHYSTASIILGFPLVGLMTWGVSSLAGIVSGIIALRRVCTDEATSGKQRAIAGICLSFSSTALIITMVLFLGP